MQINNSFFFIDIARIAKACKGKEIKLVEENINLQTEMHFSYKDKFVFLKQNQNYFLKK